MPSADERAAALAELQRDKRRLALTREQLTALDALLVAHDIVQLDDGIDWWAEVHARCGPHVYTRLGAIHEARERFESRGRRPPLTLERELYELVAERPLLGLVLSQRRPLVLDAGALLTRVIEVTALAGSALEIGCSAGHHARWLAAHPALTHVTALDLSPATIARAQALSVTCPTRATFAVGALADAEPADLVVAIDGGLRVDDPAAMRAATERLTEGGVLVIVQATPKPWRKSLERCQALGLGLAYTDIVGGWNGLELYCEPAFVFVKGATCPLPADPKAAASDAWPDFVAYLGGAAPAAKNHASWRAHATYAPRR